MTRSASGTRAKPGVHVSRKAALNRAILDNLPGERRRRLVYECPAYGSAFILVHPARTSQACGVCHLRGPASRVSRDTFICTGCGHTDDADRNASVVILTSALRASKGTAIAAGHCGEQHAPAGHARPAMPRTRAGRTREPLNPSSGTARLPVDVEGCKESQQVTAGRMSRKNRVSGQGRGTSKLAP
ncbi:zinc ribbon domain-containing protein [Streptomyces sp. RLB1-33]|uniref:zinc ribbon domain-containing protein n=1 Tax=Streptomyces mirabilis TaxID=68239 RepID=UPI00388BF4FA